MQYWLYDVGVITMATKKVGAAGKYGSRYGLRTRKQLNKIEKSSRAKYVCPNCLKRTLKRTASGIWECRKCGFKMAGGAYSPYTEAQKVMQKVIRE